MERAIGVSDIKIQGLINGPWAGFSFNYKAWNFITVKPVTVDK
jgi:hypothetical protein